MTTVVVLAESPAQQERVSSLDPVSSAEAATLYRAMLADVCETIQRGEADLLVNYPDPESGPADVDPEGTLREILEAELPAPDAVRYEVQVGDSAAARVGNAVTHLLESEDEPTAGFVDPTAALLGREHVGSAAMKLRSSEVVLGPSAGGRVYFGGFSEPIDFEDAFATPAVETLTDRGLDAGLEVDYLPVLPLLDSPEGFETGVPLVRSRLEAGRLVPPRTAALFEQWGLGMAPDGTLSRASDRS